MRRRNLPLICGLSLAAASCASSGTKPAASPPDPLSRTETLSRILTLEDSRSLGGGTLLSFMQNDDPGVRRRAVLAAGRIGDRLALPRLIQRLQDPELEVRRTAAFALGLLGSTEAVGALTTALSDVDPRTRGRAAEALGRIGQAASAQPIADAFRRALPSGQTAVLTIRGDDPARADDPWIELRLELFALARLKNAEAFASATLSSNDAPLVDWWASTWAAMRIADARLTPILLAGAGAEDPHIRSLAARGLGALKNPSHLAALKKLVEDKDPSVALQALRAVGAVGAAEGSAIAAIHVDSPNPVLRHEALLALAALPPDSKWRTRIIDNVGHTDPWIRAAAWPALIKIDGADIGIVLSTIGTDSDFRVRQAIASGIAETLGEQGAALLLPMLKDIDPRAVPGTLAAIARARGLDAVSTLQEHLQSSDMGIRAAAVEGLSSLEAKSDKTFTDLFARAYDASLADGDVEPRITIVQALAKGPGEDKKVLLRRIAGSDPSRVVRQAALGASGEGFAAPEETGLLTADARRVISVYAPGGDTLYSPRVVITTRYGAIEMVLDLVDAPLTSLSFVRLAQSGFFNGLSFHRVVPGFVIQGGDPRGDGYGGPGMTLRCEYSGRPYGRGSVGMALSGKDTGGSQFFITLEPQPHLDGAYTHFGEVISGMNVVEKIRPGDVIERIDVFDGREAR